MFPLEIRVQSAPGEGECARNPAVSLADANVPAGDQGPIPAGESECARNWEYTMIKKYVVNANQLYLLRRQARFSPQLIKGDFISSFFQRSRYEYCR
jgi:hypothetical protein